MLVDSLTRDDAAVYRLTEDRAIVATVDFFTPIVDDPYAFGAIAAANAFSDLYAMGARPLLALNIVGWPRDPDVMPLLGDVVRGAADVAREAGAFILGGHSIDDPEPKFGMVAIGEVHPDEVLTNAGARPGDALVLTKPVGTGILSTALKRGWIGEGEMGSAIRCMMTLNASALRAARAVGHAVHAMTDVTGFGLLGHLFNVLEASRVGARIFAARVPPFEGVLDLIDRRAVPGGTERNRDAAAAFTTWDEDVHDATRILLCDAQTSGGLLIAVDPARVEELLDHLVACETPAAAVIGEIVAGPPAVRVVTDAGR